VFLVEAQAGHKNAILLLDEPGLHMHGTAQEKIIEFFAKLSRDNQLLYSTHSPFMIDGAHLERARAVYEDADGTTRVSEDVWPRDRDTLFPLQAALGYQIAQSLFVAKRQVIIEGISDYWLLHALDIALATRGIPGLRQEITLVPSGGVTRLFPLASMLIGNNVEVAALLDGDEPGRREGKKLVEKLLAGQDRKCLFIGDFLSYGGAEIEDIFAEKEYLSAVSEAFGGVAFTFNDAEKAIVGVVNKVEAFFKRNDLHFVKWKPAAILRDRILASPGKVSDATCETARRIFQALNAVL